MQNISNQHGYITLQTTDNSGNYINDIRLPGDAVIFDIEVTSNDKLLVSAQHDMDELDYMLLKYNDDLQYDSVYSQQYQYDYLCPEGITSGNINLSCSIITSLENRTVTGSASLTITPNPANEYTIINLPELMDVSSKQLSVSTLRSDYVDGLEISIFNRDSKLIQAFKWPDNVKEKVLNTSQLVRGLYLIRITKNNKVLLSGKLIVNH